MRRAWKKYGTWVLLGMVLLGFLACRWEDWPRDSVWGDEGISLFFTNMTFSQYLDHFSFEPLDTNGLFYYYGIQGPWQRLCTALGHGDMTAWRIPSIASGLMALFMTFFLARRWCGDSVALGSLAFLSLNGMFHYYSSMLRFNAMDAALCLICTWLCLVAARSRHWSLWVLYGASALTCMYTVLISVLMLGGHGLYLLLYAWCKPAYRRSILLGLTGVGLCVIAGYIPLVYYDPIATERIDWYPLPDLGFWYNTILGLIGRRNYPFGGATLLVLAFFLTLGLYGTEIIVRRTWQAVRQHQAPPAIAIAVLTPAFVYLTGHIVSHLFHPVVCARSLLFIVPFNCMILAVGLHGLSRKMRALPLRALAVLTLVWLVPLLTRSCRCPQDYDWSSPSFHQQVPRLTFDLDPENNKLPTPTAWQDLRPSLGLEPSQPSAPAPGVRTNPDLYPHNQGTRNAPWKSRRLDDSPYKAHSDSK